MKTIVTVIALFLASFSYADQLAYISKSKADEAVELISKMKSVYLFCGCCSMQKPVKVSPTKVYAKFTDYEDYWEVFIEYKDDKGKTITEALDLAYVWKKKLFGFNTIGSMLSLEHDYCVKPKDWNKPENQSND